MSLRCFSKMLAVSEATSASMLEMPSSTSVRAQSNVSDTDGDFLRSNWRTDLTIRAT